MKRYCTLFALGALALPVLAHHSFAVFFDDAKTVNVTGTVVEFRFLNPHGVIRLDVDNAGKKEVWKVETNSPSILERRGWTKDSIKPGEVITIDGWPARDGANYLRMRSARHANGKPVGAPVAESTGDQK